MSTKGPSNLYKLSDKINFQYAKSFLENKLNDHAVRNGELELNITKKEYIYRSIIFANNIDKTNNQSFVDKYGSTYKRNILTKEFSVISSNGYVITYFKMSDDKKWRKIYEKRAKKR